MPHIPKAVCVQCGRELKILKTGARLEALMKTGKDSYGPYYKISADVYRCESCGIEIAVDFANEPLVMRHEINYYTFSDENYCTFRFAGE